MSLAPILPTDFEAILRNRPPGSGAGKPSDTRYCLAPNICDVTHECYQARYERGGCNMACAVWGRSIALELLRRLRKVELAVFAEDEKTFPGGDNDPELDHPTRNCTACARLVVARFGGEVRGYQHADNTTAIVGEVEGGHDFSITPDRFLVDPWIFIYYREPPVLDMDDLEDQIVILKRYGPSEKWVSMEAV